MFIFNETQWGFSFIGDDGGYYYALTSDYPGVPQDIYPMEIGPVEYINIDLNEMPF